MTDIITTLGRHAKFTASVGIFALVTMLVAGLLTLVLPESYHFALVVGWILSIGIVGRVLRGRILAPRPA